MPHETPEIKDNLKSEPLDPCSLEHDLLDRSPLDHNPQPLEQWQSFDQIPLSPVEPRHYTQVLIETAAIAITFISTLSVFLIFVATIPLPIAAIVIPALLMIGSGITWLRYLNAKAIGYAVCPHELVMQTGIIWVKRISLPYTRLQHISLSQGPLERKFYLRTLKCFSAGSGSAEIELPGLESKTAEKLRQHLLSMAAVAIKNTAIVNEKEVNEEEVKQEEPAADGAEQ
ncbi:membrane-flanked domain protein [Shewanella sediminis HAW-EB3]|uniref:Membrane-flanked domain protein n=1 Tax=Shewanella sediminis (strain HAW-EB3) TaxID=425104 RepID=A8FZN3_SHESH|nr:PH domain-containing protein [Shewanella sediminis]ABV38306.1 membrane-flanked domain protein [Shewanella sediminis HAW-EB3]